VGEAKDAGDGAGEHDFFVGPDDAGGYFAASGGNYRSGMFVSLLIEFESKKLEAITDASTDNRSVFADAASEDECVQAAESSGESTDPFSRLIAEHRNGFSSADVGFFASEEIAHVRAGF
jgi:hypothetical protein